ncbi:MAG: hypothetical protein QOI72_73 [Solirubrobacterales bacterium]|jgi:hypothetical protein|nr:hypothetical protein [Solirubrobacterales bacterium]
MPGTRSRGGGWGACGNNAWRSYCSCAIVEDLSSLRDACIVTSEARGKHNWPPQLSVPDSWAEPYRALAGEMQFPVADVDDAADDVRAFIAAIDAEA